MTYTFQQELARKSPAGWIVASNDGNTLSASCPATGETFSGTPAAYAAKFTSAAGDVNLRTGYKSTVALTRTADANAYASGDVVGNANGCVLAFTEMGPPDSNIMFTSIDMRMDLSSVPTNMGSFRLHMYSATPPSALADNAVWDLPSGDRAAYLGYLDLGTPVDVGATLFIQNDGVNRQVQLTGSTLYCYLVVNTTTSTVALGSAAAMSITLRSVSL